MPAPRAANAVGEMCLTLNPRSPRCQTGAVSASRDLCGAEAAGGVCWICQLRRWRQQQGLFSSPKLSGRPCLCPRSDPLPPAHLGQSSRSGSGAACRLYFCRSVFFYLRIMRGTLAIYFPLF